MARRATKKKASPPARKVKVCKAGLHPMTASNSYDHPTKGKLCRACLRDYQRDYMAKWRAKNKAAERRAARKKLAAKAAKVSRPVAKKAARKRPAARKR